MTLIRLLKSLGFSISLALFVLVVGLAIENVWLAWGLPGVHWIVGAPVASAMPLNLMRRMYETSTTVSDSYAYVSLAPSFIFAAMGLVVGFWWTFRS
jgi:hypothetical protein